MGEERGPRGDTVENGVDRRGVSFCQHERRPYMPYMIVICDEKRVAEYTHNFLSCHCCLQKQSDHKRGTVPIVFASTYSFKNAQSTATVCM